MRKSRATDHHGSEFAHFRMDAKCPFHWSVSLCWPVQRPGERQASFIEDRTSKDEYSVGSLIQINLRRWPPSAISKISEAGPHQPASKLSICREGAPLSEILIPGQSSVGAAV